jgi:hypothetical protein
VAASGVIHLFSLYLAQNGVDGMAGMMGGVLSLSWEALLALFLAVVALVLWLVFGLSAVALMSPGVAVAVVVAALAALNVVELVPSKGVAKVQKEKPVPVEVAVLETSLPEKPDNKEQKSTPPPDKPVPAAPMFSASLADTIEDGMKKKGDSVKGKLWTVHIPVAVVSAAEKTPKTA